ncbi:RdgB/HAM1 family non-canonical purine NTP pyrophosphatase [Coxiella endosymbiont of Rhipicephalus microplus]|uniref:RdgB/HAM1 family non-canonical purine NTP pyrophosphatase n=1 Tax=Coxiella endosymbiont of Rhipicephalus microplus TaxID=1656186 RepID=UPI000C7F9FC6|nr:RdgB/HAM1 family non-canonical purine NTP pyrophosphatase [Coxiella endosymbiont of Rhipicephalus microplus]PMB54273.1 Nucleoside 5-triphosphatase RdgB (dHAPTP, dITP, XTP-specific) [Coxiella-like endosymbiont]
MLEIVLASQNEGKLIEIQDLLKSLEIRFIPQTKLNIPPVEETGTTFVENAIIKARHAAKYSGLPALADDSGLIITALNSAPGVFSSRYAGGHATDSDRIQKVLKELENIDSRDRSASFHCILALIENETDPAPLICHGVWEGNIVYEPKGKNGFGYDPIFYIPSHRCTAAELDFKEKNPISHRGQALQELMAILTNSFLV